MDLSFRDCCAILWWLMEGGDGPGLHGTEALSNLYRDVDHDTPEKKLFWSDLKTFVHECDVYPDESCESIYNRVNFSRQNRVGKNAPTA